MRRTLWLVGTFFRFSSAVERRVSSRDADVVEVLEGVGREAQLTWASAPVASLALPLYELFAAGVFGRCFI